MGELADQGIDLAEREGRGGTVLEVAADEAVGGGAAVQGGGTGVVDDGGPVLLDRGHDAEDPADAGGAVAAVDRVAHGADPRPGAGGPGQERQGGRRGAGGLVHGARRIVARTLGPVLAEQLARGRV